MNQKEVNAELENFKELFLKMRVDANGDPKPLEVK